MIFITGASKGIGAYLLDKYASEGDICGTYNETHPVYHRELYSKVDITNYNAVNKWVNKHLLGGNITLINCAGINYNAFAHKADHDTWKKVIDTNIVGTFNVIQCLLPIMRKMGYGRIINFGSVVSKYPTIGVSAYATSKSALEGMSKSISAENASKGITINNINLGYSNIGMGKTELSDDIKAIITQTIPIKRFCEPIDIFNTVEYLRNTSYITGTSIDINGGLI